MNTLKGFKDFDKVIRPAVTKENKGRRYTLPSIYVGWLSWMSIVKAEFCGIFEVQNYKIRHYGHKDSCLVEFLIRKENEENIPFDFFLRLHSVKHKAEPVIVRLTGWCRDTYGNPIIQIERSSGFCYNTPVAGSKGGEKPEPQ